MKTNSFFSKISAVLLATGLFFAFEIPVFSQSKEKPTLAVLAFRNDLADTKISIPFFLADLLRQEFEKSNQYQVLDLFDMDFLMNQNKIDYQNCLSRYCLEDISSKLNIQKLVVANITQIDSRISITVKIFDKTTKQFEKAQTMDYLNIHQEIGTMVHLTANQLLGIPNDEAILTKLSKKNDFASALNNPEQLCLRNDGPRMGFTTFLFEPKTSKILRDKKYNGGFETFPLFFQFGYQFEKQYLNEGNFQALFEFIPMVTGLDQGLFIPSITVLNGIRNNKNGWEFAFGPTVSIVTKSKGYYDENNSWNRIGDGENNDSGFATETRLDSRGNPALATGFVIAGGKTFKSGRLNIPVNLYFIPLSDGFRCGFSFGFNAKSRYSN
jgi:hypothetical protein